MIIQSFLLFFLERILVHTPSRRPTIEQLLDCQWFRYAQEHATQLGRGGPQANSQNTTAQSSKPNHVPRRRKGLFWFLPTPRERLSSTESNASSRDISSAAKNNQLDHFHHHHHHHHHHPNQPTTSSSTKSSASRDERLANPEIPNLRTIACSTKRATSVLEENFLHPFKAAADSVQDGVTPIVADRPPNQHPHHIKDLSNDVSNNNIINNNSSNSENYNNNMHSNGTEPPGSVVAANGNSRESAGSQERKTRRFSFGRTLKKRIGPMELVTTESLGGGPDGSGIGGSQRVNLREKLHRTIDDEHGRFVMYPTVAVSSEGNRHLHPLETETRRLMKALGINGEMIARAVVNGPRSDIIGVYRIIMHRLQREQARSRLAATNGGAYEFLELKSINPTGSAGRWPNGDTGRSTANSRRHIDQNRGRICAIL